MCHLILAGLLEHEVDTVAGGLLAHEPRLGRGLRVYNFVVTVLVTVRARKIALVRDVQHHRGEREVFLRKQPLSWLGRLRGIADSTDLAQFLNTLLDFPGGKTIRQGLRDLPFGQVAVFQRVENRLRGFIELENRGTGYQIGERLARTFEPVELPQSE